MNVIDLKTHPTTHWKQTIADHYPFLPYWWIRGVTPPSRQALMFEELDQVSLAEKTHLLGCTYKGDLLGFAQVRWLEWDTNHFGLEIWRLEHLGMWGSSTQQQAIAQALIQGVVQRTCEQGCKNIQARVPIDNLPAIHALERAGFQTMEVLTAWLFDLTKSPIPAKINPDPIRDFKPADSESLIELARSAYTPVPDRFHVDPRLSPQASDELYAEWIRNSCSGQLADQIAVAESDGKAVGYATMKYFGDHDGLCNVRIAQLGLGAVSPDLRNRGLITDLIIQNLEWLNHRQADFCFVGTQGNNIPVQRAWLKVGFNPAMMSLTLHYWLDD